MTKYIIIIVETLILITGICYFFFKGGKEKCLAKNFETFDIDIYKEIFNQTNQLIGILSNDMTFKYGNKALLEFLEQDLDELLGIPYWELPMWEHSKELQNKIMFSLERIYLGEEAIFETTNANKKGVVRDIDFTIKPIFNKKQEVEFLIAMGYDVTDLKLFESALKRTEKELKLFFDYSKDAYLIFRLREPIYLENHDRKALFDYIVQNEKISIWNEEAELILNKTKEEMEELKHKMIFLKSEDELFDIWDKLLSRESIEMEQIFDNHGKKKFINIKMVALYDELGRYSGSAFVGRDITRERETEDKLKFLANKDGLTGLNNRRFYIEEIQKLLGNNELEYIVVLDLDDFKKINDTYGHDAGDIVLVEVSNELELWVKGKGVAGRLGGEEFSAALKKSDGVSEKYIEELRARIEALNINVGNINLKITASIGVSKVFENDWINNFKRADTALYKAKSSGKNKVIISQDSFGLND